MKTNSLIRRIESVDSKYAKLKKKKLCLQMTKKKRNESK